MKPVRKVVFPVNGLGTRFLPATKAMPKEMLPVVDMPLIQYAVAEAAAAGIKRNRGPGRVVRRAKGFHAGKAAHTQQTDAAFAAASTT